MIENIDFSPVDKRILIDDLSNTFKHSIRINPELKRDIDDVYRSILLNMGKTNISIFNFKYIQMLESFAKHDVENKELVEFSESIIKHINTYFKELDFCLNIRNKDDLDNLDFILKLSSFMLENAIEFDDIDLAYESFFQIERRIKKCNLYNDYKIYNIGDYIKFLCFFPNFKDSINSNLVNVDFEPNDQNNGGKYVLWD